LYGGLRLLASIRQPSARPAVHLPILWSHNNVGRRQSIEAAAGAVSGSLKLLQQQQPWPRREHRLTASRLELKYATAGGVPLQANAELNQPRFCGENTREDSREKNRRQRYRTVENCLIFNIMAKST